MSDYFNATGTIGFTCDNCGRELLGCTWVNGMKFCAKCYQETFGASKDWQLLDKDKTIAEQRKQIADLEAKLEEKESKVAVGRFWHSAYEGKQLDYDKLNDDYNKQEKLLSEVLANKSELQFEYDQLKQQLAEKETRIAELEDKDWYEGTIKQLEEQNERLINQLAEKTLTIEQINKAFIENRSLWKGKYEQANQDKISFALVLLEKVKEYNHTLVFSSSLIDKYIDNQIKQLKEMN